MGSNYPNRNDTGRNYPGSADTGRNYAPGTDTGRNYPKKNPENINGIVGAPLRESVDERSEKSKKRGLIPVVVVGIIFALLLVLVIGISIGKSKGKSNRAAASAAASQSATSQEADAKGDWDIKIAINNDKFSDSIDMTTIWTGSYMIYAHITVKGPAGETKSLKGAWTTPRSYVANDLTVSSGDSKIFYIYGDDVSHIGDYTFKLYDADTNELIATKVFSILE